MPSAGLSAPRQLYVTATGTIMVVNASSQTDGKSVRLYGEGSNIPTIYNMSNPTSLGMVQDPNTGNIYVSTYTSNSIIKIASDGTTSTFITGLSRPEGLALNADGSKLYVTNPGGSNVKIYSTADGSLLSTANLSGSHIPYPIAVAVDSDANFYVVDHRGTNLAAVTGTARVIKFDSNNNSSVFAQNYVDPTNANTADTPSGVAVDAANNVYVLVEGRKAGGSGSIVKYDSSGNFIELFRPSSPNTLNKISIGIFVANDYKIYVSDSTNNQIIYYAQTLDAPSSPVVSSTGGTVHLSWTAIPDTRRTSVMIRRSTSDFPTSTNDGILAGSSTSTTFDDTAPADGTYYYSLFSVDTLGEFSLAATTSITLNFIAPSAPAFFTASGSGTTVNLSWTNPADIDFSSITIRRSIFDFPTSTNDGTLVSSTITGTSFLETGLADATYYYSLFAVDTSGNYSSAATASVIIDTVAPLISAVTSTPRTTSTLIEWTTTEAASSQIFFSADANFGSSTPLTDTGNDMTTSHSLTLRHLLPCSMYNYKVVSLDNAANAVTSSATVFTTTGCTGGAAILASANTPISTSVSSSTQLTRGAQRLSLTTPINFTTSSSLASFQIKAFDSTTILANLGKPRSNLTTVGSTVFDLKALIDTQTILDSFASPLTISITYTDEDVVGLDLTTLTLYHYHADTWSPLSDCAVNTTNKTVTCTTDSFSIFALFGNTETITSPITRTDTYGGGGSYIYGFGCSDPKALNFNRYASPLYPGHCDYPESKPIIPFSTTSSQPNLPTKPENFFFKRTLQLGSIGADVRALQIFLNTHGFIVAKKGPGSFGKESVVYGPATLKALALFQTKYADLILKPLHLKHPTGVLGIATRKIVEKMMDKPF